MALCQKLARAMHLDQTVEEAMLLDSEPWPFHMETYEQQASAFLQTQTTKWQWAITTGKISEHKVVRHIMGKIVPQQLREMVYMRMPQMAAPAQTDNRMSCNIPTLGTVVMQSATLIDNAYKAAMAKHLQNVRAEEEANRMQRTIDGREYQHLNTTTRPHKSQRQRVTKFVPDAYPSDDKLKEMNETSSDDDDSNDLFESRMVADIIDKMEPHEREETLQELNEALKIHERNKTRYGDNVLSTRARAQRPQMQTKGLTKQQKKLQRKLDRIVQKDLLRRVRKWDRVAAKGRETSKWEKESDEHSHGEKPTKQPTQHRTSPGKNSMSSQFSLNDAETMQQLSLIHI